MHFWENIEHWCSRKFLINIYKNMFIKCLLKNTTILLATTQQDVRETNTSKGYWDVLTDIRLEQIQENDD